MQKNLRTTGDEQLAQQRWQCDQARIQAAALNGELGPQRQIIALSELYMARRAAGDIEGAAALKAQANAIVTAQKGY